MPKVIECTIKPFVGSVTLYDPMAMPMVMGLDVCLTTRRDFFEEKEVDGDLVYTLKSRTGWSAPDSEALKGIIPCVEKWELACFPESVTVETFPGTPRVASKKLVDWLLAEILKVYSGELEIPNE